MFLLHYSSVSELKMREICNNRVTSVSMHGVLHVCHQVFSWVTLEAVDRTFVYLSDFLSSYYTGMIVLLFHKTSYNNY